RNNRTQAYEPNTQPSDLTMGEVKQSTIHSTLKSMSDNYSILIRDAGQAEGLPFVWTRNGKMYAIQNELSPSRNSIDLTMT
ncbi:hypothetical protein L9F63_023925, partial [Diploptera punctata]